MKPPLQALVEWRVVQMRELEGVLLVMSTKLEKDNQSYEEQDLDNQVDNDVDNSNDEHMRKQDDIESIAAEETGIHKDTVKTAFNAVWNAICKELEQGNDVKLHGKGRFYLSKRSARIGRNPSTGEEFDVPEREAMAFQTSPAYAKRLREYRKNQVKQELGEHESKQEMQEQE